MLSGRGMSCGAHLNFKWYQLSREAERDCACLMYCLRFACFGIQRGWFMLNSYLICISFFFQSYYFYEEKRDPSITHEAFSFRTLQFFSEGNQARNVAFLPIPSLVFGIGAETYKGETLLINIHMALSTVNKNSKNRRSLIF